MRTKADTDIKGRIKVQLNRVTKLVHGLTIHAYKNCEGITAFFDKRKPRYK